MAMLQQNNLYEGIFTSDDLYKHFMRLEDRYKEAMEAWTKINEESKKKWYHKIF